MDFTSLRARTVSLHHVTRVNERATLAAKAIADTSNWNSMVSAGYRMRFRNTATTLHGQVDSYGNVRLVVEREPVKDVRVAFGAEMRLMDKPENSFGLRLSVGSTAPLPRNLSPILMSRDVFGPM